MISNNKIKICSYHRGKEETPLIWTFAFNGAEYWCPACGMNEGMLGAGINIPSTKVLRNRLARYKQRSRTFLTANGRLICAQLKYKGEWIKFEELPQKSKTYWINRAKEWKYKYK